MTEPAETHQDAEEPAAQASGEPTEAAIVLQAELAAREARMAELEQQLGATTQELEASRAGLGDAQRQGLEHLRRALLAEHHGQVVPELLVGATTEELQASVEVARAAFQRAADAARQQLQTQHVPAGNPPRGQEDLGSLSPVEKIAHGLSRQ